MVSNERMNVNEGCVTKRP